MCACRPPKITKIKNVNLATLTSVTFGGPTCFPNQISPFAETKAVAEPTVHFYTKIYLELFTLEETIEYTRSVYSISPNLGYPYFLPFVCKHLSAAENQIQPPPLEGIWRAIFDQLGREKFGSDISQLSAQDCALVREFASLGESEIPVHHLTGKNHRQYLARLIEKGLLVRMGRGRYKVVSPTLSRVPEAKTMKQSNSGSENVRAVTRRQACCRVTAVPFPLNHDRADSIP